MGCSNFWLGRIFRNVIKPMKVVIFTDAHIMNVSRCILEFTSFVLVNYDSPPCVSRFSFITKIPGSVEQLMAVVVKTLGHLCVMYFYQYS